MIDQLLPERKRGREEEREIGAGRRKSERKEETESKERREGWREVAHIYSTHIAAIMTNLHTILSFESFFPLVLQCAPLWKSSCVAEGETGVARFGLRDCRELSSYEGRHLSGRKPK